MKPGEIYRVEKNEDEDLKDVKYIKFKDIKKDENNFKFHLTILDKSNEKSEMIVIGEKVFNFISSGYLVEATDRDKAKLVLGQKGF